MTGLSPYLAPPSRILGPDPSLRTLLQTTIRTMRLPNFQAGLFPIRSPLLGKSLFSGLLTTSSAANHPRRRNPNTSPDHSIDRSDGRDSAIANGDPPIGARCLDDVLTPQQGGIPLRERPMRHRGRIFEQQQAYLSAKGGAASKGFNTNASSRKFFEGIVP
ncbi:hypothetical protein RHMOL_Rhmol10G0190200 [Rhododendron molle]|uniref:Uncharacterized protein n=1 Tax=Rhododendron molle TaxID=49168 RepID=A0ACC0M549_RHOML|nr:hypothetical protein RHMOL_Rhmol10G0190200 [Rhododendron molle]